VRLLVLSLWAGAVGLALLGVLRLVAFDDAQPLLLANALTYWIYLPAYGIVAVAIALRRYRLVALATAVVALHVVIVWPLLAGADPIPNSALEAPRLRIFSANVLYDNAEPKGLVREMVAADADVILLQEFSGYWERILRDTTIWADYPYRIVARPTDITGGAILSRTPLTHVAKDVFARASLLLATVTVGDQPVRLVNVHPNAPAFNYERWRTYKDGTNAVLARIEGLMIVAGDFNATPFNAWLGELDDLGLESAHEARGRGTATTWPNGELTAPPLQLDHVLVSGGVVPLAIREGDGEGSDHKPLISDLALVGLRGSAVARSAARRAGRRSVRRPYGGCRRSPRGRACAPATGRRATDRRARGRSPRSRAVSALHWLRPRAARRARGPEARPLRPGSARA
jgi:endonuclease/exonuclease/phosphatase (EEP) superfamily protein YafD